jgi:CBS domain containing-hemolysin-like protein
MTDSSPSQVPAQQMAQAILRLERHTAREIMVPRIDVCALEVSASLQEAVDLVVKEEYSRIPVYEETIDRVIGILNAKDLLRYWRTDSSRVYLKDLVRPVYFIPESKRLDELLKEMRDQQAHLAIVVDEYGGTAGLVTMEDLLEEIVGEIYDEYDVVEPSIERIADNQAIIDARMPVEEVNRALSLDLPSTEVNTIGGFVYHHLGKIPSPGDVIETDHLHIEVCSVSGRRIRKLKVTVLTPE